MRDLRLIGVHDDGEHLVVMDEGGQEYCLRIDEQLRAAARRDRPRLGQLQIAIDNNVRPREVQSMIRAGATADEVAARTGWDLEKVARFEGPIIAEREYIAGRARGVRMRGVNQAGAHETLTQRAATRFKGRGVDPATVGWDSYRDREGQWTVSAAFAAGGRERTATWWFDLAGMSVVARNDEAKWLSEADAPAGPVPAAVHRPTAVFDVEVEENRAERSTRANTDDLIASMREQSGVKSRRRGGRRRSRAAEAPGAEEPLPLAAEPVEDASPQSEPPQREPAQPDPPQSEPTQPEPPHSEPAHAAEEPPTTAQGTDPEAPSTTESARHIDVPELSAAVEAGDDPGAARPATATEDAAPTDPQRQRGDSSDRAGEDHDVTDDAPDPAADPAEEDRGPESTASTNNEEAAAPATPGKGRARKGRASVPSWDDVMFGTGRD